MSSGYTFRVNGALRSSPVNIAARVLAAEFGQLIAVNLRPADVQGRQRREGTLAKRRARRRATRANHPSQGARAKAHFQESWGLGPQ